MPAINPEPAPAVSSDMADTIPAPTMPPAELTPLHVERLELYDEVSRAGACSALAAPRIPRSIND